MAEAATTRLYPPTNQLMPEQGGDVEEGYASRLASDERVCRICLESDATDEDPHIAPCRCKGSMRWVHRSCLDEWRAQEQVPLAFSHCPQCKFQYRTVLCESEQRVRRMKLALFVARDSVALFAVVQCVIGTVAFLLHACDPTGAVLRLYPQHWAETHAVAHLSIGPYYVTTVIALLALLGLVGLCLYCSGHLPGQGDASRRRARRSGSCCDSTSCDCAPCYYCHGCNESDR